MDLTGHLEQLIPATSEAAYDRLTCYRFAQRYVEGKGVADIGWGEVGYGSQLLAQTAESVAGLTTSTEALDLARTTYPAPNAEYKKVDLPGLPFPEDYFDVVVAFGVVENLERPEALVRETKRVLKQDGVLLISVLDRRVLVEEAERVDQWRGMYIPQFRGLLEQQFERVLVYRQGAVAGGFVFPEAEKMTGALVESARLALTDPYISAEPPTTCSVIAVCSDVEVSEERPYLLLDRNRRVFDECEDRAEDVELLREEIQRMQKTEVQAFQDSLKLHRTEIAYLRARIRRSDAQIHGLKIQLQSLKNHIRAMENSTTWRIFEPYRRLRARMDARKKRSPESTEESGGDQSG